MDIIILVVLFLYVYKVYMGVAKIKIFPYKSRGTVPELMQAFTDPVQITVGKWTKTVERDWLKDY